MPIAGPAGARALFPKPIRKKALSCDLALGLLRRSRWRGSR
jgi:hypothetical protein